ncbi:MAG TPA: elongator complex protein 3, partial [Candidatus Thermoplasmatota archaeon]|nr:elongator complex protein 3 [Candidatus Thermoplasmatota archaeon]
PDWCFEEHVDRMLAHGVTRVEVGLQCLDDEVLRFTHRGHTLQDGRDALRIARDAGLKVCVHMMPGLPRKRRPSGPGWDTDAEADVEDFRRLFAEPEWRPDMLKIYPTLVVEEGETGLKAMWRRGEYAPLTTQEAAAVVARAKAHVPEWCRIQRVDRDIPTTHVLAGVMQSNLRQLVEAEQRRLGLPACRCIRCREAGRRSGAPAETLELHRTEFAAGGGTECFLSLEDPDRNALVGYLRLRRVGPDAHRPETRVPGGAAIARELKVHGTSLAVGAEGGATGAFQHRGHGSRLLWEAERIAFEEWGCGRLLVIAGPGVKPYYRKRHYHDVGPYVGRDGA